jgi:transcriptional regulator with XRE-family HTH domain
VSVNRNEGVSAPESIGALLCRLRLARGYTQLRLAELLCAASGVPTVGRHEISRWEREERVPGGFWLGWLAAVLDVPLDELELAAAGAGRPRSCAAGPPRPVRSGGLLALAHAWLVQPPGTFPPAILAGTVGAATAAEGSARARTERAALFADPVRLIIDLRRMDDLVGGSSLTGRVTGLLQAATGALPAARRADRRRVLALLAELGQLAGWVAADAGDAAGSAAAYRVGMGAAAAGGDRPLAGHILGCASHAALALGDPREALLLARTGCEGARRAASAGGRALMLHRVAVAAARCGERRAAQAALSAADHAVERRDPAGEPAWLYWLDDAELAAMTGRCMVVLGRPLRAVGLLAAATRADRAARSPRTAAVYAGWLARAYLDLGEIEHACAIAEGLLLDAVRLGSARVAAQAAALHLRLVRHTDVPAAVRYARLAEEARAYLPAGRGWPARRSSAGGG